MTALLNIAGVGEYADKLRTAGVRSTDALLRVGATRTGRRALAAQSGAEHGLILRWVNHADLLRIRGVAGEYAELLEAAGVDTVGELTRRNPAHLAARLAEVNAQRNLCRVVPSHKRVAGWIAQAKALPRVVMH
jgi:hypothetical protein